MTEIQKGPKDPLEVPLEHKTPDGKIRRPPVDRKAQEVRFDIKVQQEANKVLENEPLQKSEEKDEEKEPWWTK